MNIIEDENSIYCKSLKDIESNFKLFKNSGWGANSNIFIYNQKELLKVFNFSDSYFNQLIMEKIKKIKTQSLVKPNKFLIINNEYHGFTMDLVKGEMIDKIKPYVLLKDFLNSLKNVEKDLYILAKNKLVHDDINVLNIIYDNKTKRSTIIDSNSIKYINNLSFEVLYIGSCISLYASILDALSKQDFYKSSNNEALNCMRNSIINNDGKDSIDIFFNRLIEYLENIVDKEINTINDFRKALVLSNKY